jgi:peptide-methionine (S)-S-oxide reductase
LPSNIAQVAQTIIDAAQRRNADSQQEQLDFALRLVCWSWIARECGVSIALVDVLVDAGASVDGRSVYGGRYSTHSDSAIYNGNFAVAERLLERGAEVTLTTALCLGRWVDVDRLAPTATLDEKQDAFVQAAMSGKAEAVGRMLALGMNPTTVSARNQSHATALHHAVCSASLDAVRVLIEAGADINRRDTIYDATPLGWAKYFGQQEKDALAAKKYAEIAAYLLERGGQD